YDDAELSFYHIRSDNEIEQECLRKIIADNLGLKDASKMYILDETGNSSIFPIYSNSDVFLIAIDINEARKGIEKRNSFAISDFCISLIKDFEEIFEKIGYYNAEDLLFIEDKLIENNIEKGTSYRDYLKENFRIERNKIIQFNYNSEYLIENRERFIEKLKNSSQQKEQLLDNCLTNFSEQEQLLNKIEVPFEN
ncbi:30401_t:CDS:1, partial [Racocetra persica]